MTTLNKTKIIIEAQRAGYVAVGFNRGGTEEYFTLKEYLSKDMDGVVGFLNKPSVTPTPIARHQKTQ